MEDIRRAYQQLIDSGLSSTALQREMFRELKAAGFTNQQIMDGIRLITAPSISNNLVGNNESDCVNAVDVFSQEPIPVDSLVSVTENGKKYCFDSQSLYQYLKESDTNPYTNVTFPREFIETVNSLYPSVEVYTPNGKITVKKFTQLGDVILDVLRSSHQNFPQSFENDVQINGSSLYTEDLMSEYPFENGDHVYVHPFQSLDARDNSLISMLTFLNKKRTSSVTYESLHGVLGSYLGILPGVITPDGGVDMPFDEDDTIYDAVKKIYMLLGGIQKIRDTKLVLDNGIPLLSLELDQRVIDAIPGEIIRIVDYNEDDYDNYDDDDDIQTRIPYLGEFALYSLIFNDEDTIIDLREAETGSRNVTDLDLMKQYLINQSELADIFIDFLNRNETPPVQPYPIVEAEFLSEWMPIFYSKIARHLLTSNITLSLIQSKVSESPLVLAVTKIPLNEITNEYNYHCITGVRLNHVQSVLNGEYKDPYVTQIYDDVLSYTRLSDGEKKLFLNRQLSRNNFNCPRIRSYIIENDDMISAWKVSLGDKREFFNRFNGQNMFELLLYIDEEDIETPFLNDILSNITAHQINSELLKNVIGMEEFLNDPRLIISLDYVIRSADSDRDEDAFMKRLESMPIEKVQQLGKHNYDYDVSNFLLSKGVFSMPEPSIEITYQVINSQEDITDPEYTKKILEYISQPGITRRDLVIIARSLYSNKDIVKAVIENPRFQLQDVLNEVHVMATIFNYRLVPVDVLIRQPGLRAYHLENIPKDIRTKSGNDYITEVAREMVRVHSRKR